MSAAPSLSRPLSLRGRALRCLAAREHSRVELSRKLAPHAESPEQVAQVLDDLEAQGLLSAQRFTEALVHRKAARYGAARVQAELAQHQLPPDITRDALQALRQTEFERAQAVWCRRFGTPPVDLKDKARHIRFLSGRGFSGEVVRRLLSTTGLSGEAPDEGDA